MASPGRLDELLDELRECIRRERKHAQDSIGTLVRTQLAQGLAPVFLTESRPYERNQQLAEMIDRGVLDRSAFIQKPPGLLRFYKRIVTALDREPERILEIGVKGGGSTALWKAVFPSATVVGFDIKLPRRLASRGPAEGVIYVQGDQADDASLAAVAAEHGPFDLVIDDGSHVSDHQAASLRSLLRHVRAGGLYVIEDVHSTLKGDEARKVNYGEDIWPDFVLTLFERLRGGPTSGNAPGSRLALEASPLTDELIVGEQALALRVRALP
jgi:cephalosporin hydroxylase